MDVVCSRNTDRNVGWDEHRMGILARRGHTFDKRFRFAWWWRARVCAPQTRKCSLNHVLNFWRQYPSKPVIRKLLTLNAHWKTFHECFQFGALLISYFNFLGSYLHISSDTTKYFVQGVRAALYVVVRLPYESHATVVEMLTDRAANNSWNRRIGVMA